MFFDPIRRFADFHGRSRRQEFWPFAIFVWVTRWFGLLAIVFGFGALSYAGGGGASGDGAAAIPIGVALILGGCGYLVATLIALVSVTARRMHDIGMTGWLTLLHFLPLCDLVLYALAMIEGPAGPNRYGDDPKGPAVLT